MKTHQTVEIDVILADSDDLVRHGLRSFLHEEIDIQIVGEARCAGEAIQLAERYAPDVVITEAWGQPIEVVDLFHRFTILGARIIALASLDDDSYLFTSLKAGASGFLLKSATQAELSYAVRAVAAGHAVICPPMTRRLIDRFEIRPPTESQSCVAALITLSGRETQVLEMIAFGRSNSDIGTGLCLSLATVKSHVSNILAKLNLENRTQAALFASHLGLTGADRGPPLVSGRTAQSSPRPRIERDRAG